MLGCDQIALGHSDYVLAGGMESMTNAPFIVSKARAGLRMGHSNLLDTMFTDGLEDAETGVSMGSFAQETADHHQLTRESMDEFAIGFRSACAQRHGPWKIEIRNLDHQWSSRG